jgi:hypothetical protein
MDEWATRRTTRKIRALLKRTGLDLTGLRVYTEAATGAYRIGPALALLAGAASVHAVARSSRFGTAAEAIAQARAFAESAGVDPARLGFTEGHSPEALAAADLVTNMGMLRPIDAAVIARIEPGAVITLMYEPWELRREDVDLAAAEARGVEVVGVNEGHPRCDCVGGVSLMVLRALLDAGLSVLADDLLLVCGNRFAGGLVRDLRPHCQSLEVLDDGAAGELPAGVRRRERREVNPSHYDALVLVDAPAHGAFNVAADAAARWPRRALGTWDACIQAMGNVRREDFAGVRFRPEAPPPPDYMGTNPASLGPDLVARLVTAGLAAGAEVLARRRTRPAAGEAARSEASAMEWALPLPRR